MGWFADWHDNFTVSDINWGGYNTMAFFTSVVSPWLYFYLSLIAFLYSVLNRTII